MGFSSSQSLLLQIGQAMLEEEAQEAEEEKMKYMEENCPSLSVPGCMQELQVTVQYLDTGWRSGGEVGTAELIIWSFHSISYYLK